MKKAQGISLISLIVTIVVIIILASIVIYNGLGSNVDQTASTMDYNELFEVSEAVAQRALLNRLNSEAYSLIGENGDFEVTMIEGPIDDKKEVKRTLKASDGWYKISKENAQDLNLENIRREYYVNYKTNEVVVSEVPIIYEENYYSSAGDLKDALGGGSVVVSPSRYDEEKGVNKPFVVSGMIPVKIQNGNWVVTNVDDPDWYDYASNSEGKGNLWANVMLMDEIEVEGMTNSEVRKTNLTQIDGKVVTKEGSMYVWIPRYSRGVADGGMTIVYSRGTDDCFSENSTENVLDAFRDNGTELTGIWVSKYDAGYIEK